MGEPLLPVSESPPALNTSTLLPKLYSLIYDFVTKFFITIIWNPRYRDGEIERGREWEKENRKSWSFRSRRYNTSIEWGYNGRNVKSSINTRNAHSICARGQGYRCRYKGRSCGWWMGTPDFPFSMKWIPWNLSGFVRSEGSTFMKRV